MTRIAIFSVSAGAGHVRAAQALEAAAVGMPSVETVHVDVMTLVPRPFRKAYTDGYLKVSSVTPALWGYMYKRTDTADVDSAVNTLREAIERLNLRKFDHHVRAMAPDAIVCTHFLPAQLLSREIGKGRFDTPVWVQVTDFDLHASWVHEHMAGYLAADDAVADRMVARGIPERIVHVTGIPVMPVFGEALSRSECAGELGLDPTRPTIALLAGSAGATGIEDLVDRLLALDERLQLIALAGRNEALLGRLRARARVVGRRLVPSGFTTTIERLMAASDIVVTKSGGLTSSECLAMGLPMIVVSPIPGQEEQNARFLVARGAALEADDEAELAAHVGRLLAEPEALERMRISAKALGRPDAARAVLDLVTGS
jgi:processive 1,2-diacylglycerol beta-glucosyltransferase